MVEYGFQCHIQVFIAGSPFSHVAEEFGRQDKKAFRIYQIFPGLLRVFVRQQGVIEIFAAGFDFSRVYVVRQVFRNVPVKHHSQYVALEIPAVYTAPQFVCNRPYRTVQLVPFLFFSRICHVFFLSSFYFLSVVFFNLSSLYISCCRPVFCPAAAASGAGAFRRDGGWDGRNRYLLLYYYLGMVYKL